MSVTETGATIWLTGLPSAGKTTIAYELAGRLRGEGHRVEVLDGDEIRSSSPRGSASPARTATPTSSGSASSPSCWRPTA